MYVKTPLIIKETLGQEVYDMFEEYRKQYAFSISNRAIHIWTSTEGERLINEAILEEWKSQKGNIKEI